MKKFLASCIVIFLSIATNVYAEKDSSQNNDDTKSGVIIASHSTSSSGTIKRAPLRVDILLCIENDRIIVRFNDDFGVCTYNFSNISLDTQVSEEVNTSIIRELSIPYWITVDDIYFFDFEFEDGSSCHLIWNAN